MLSQADNALLTLSGPGTPNRLTNCRLRLVPPK